MDFAVGVNDSLLRICAHSRCAHVMPNPPRLLELLISLRSSRPIDEALDTNRSKVIDNQFLRDLQRAFDERREPPVEDHTGKPELITIVAKSDPTVRIRLWFDNGQELPASSLARD